MISNGYDTEKVKAALQNRVGWKQPTVEEYAKLDADNLVSKSGRFFTEFHASVTVQNIYDNQDNPEISDADFNDYLRDLKSGVIDSMLSAVFSETQSIDEARLLFERIEDTEIREVPAGSNSFVGYRLKVATGSYAAQLHNVELFFNDDVEFTLFLYKDLKKTPVFSQEVAAVGNDLTRVNLDDWIVNDGVYYLGYYPEDLGAVKALDIQRCDRCMNIVGFTPVSIPVIGLHQLATTKQQYPDYTYGLNFEVSTYNDFTDKIIRHAQMFDTLIGLQYAIRVIDDVMFSFRSNATERIGRENINAMDRDVNAAMTTPDQPFSPGLKSKLKAEIKKVHKMFFPDKEITTTMPERDVVYQRNDDWNRRTYPKHSKGSVHRPDGFMGD